MGARKSKVIHNNNPSPIIICTVLTVGHKNIQMQNNEENEKFLSFVAVWRILTNKNTVYIINRFVPHINKI